MCDDSKPNVGSEVLLVIEAAFRVQDVWNTALAFKSNEEQSMFDVQICMAAYSKLVLKRVCDDVPLMIFELLIHKVQSRSLRISFMEIDWFEQCLVETSFCQPRYPYLGELPGD